MRIEFEVDGISRGVTLLVGGVAQSHVDPADPARLFFEYARRIGHVVDALGVPGAPMRVLHLGGGALTLARYVAATRPGSTQVVVEHDAALLEAVLARLPAPAGVSFVVEDAARVIADEGAPGPFDLVVVDLYTGLVPPEFVIEAGFLAGCLDRLAPTGVLVANVADAAGLDRMRELARAVARVRPEAALLITGDTTVLGGAEEGNSVLVVAPGGVLPAGLERRLREKGPHPVDVLVGSQLDFVLWDAC